MRGSVNRVATQYIQKVSASGMFGFTKAVQRESESAINKIRKKADKIVNSLERRHPEAGAYLSARSTNANCTASQVLAGSCLINKQPRKVLVGPMGFKPATAKACHKAITDLILYTGEVASNLHKRQGDHPLFLIKFVKKSKCPHTKLLIENMTDV